MSPPKIQGSQAVVTSKSVDKTPSPPELVGTAKNLADMPSALKQSSLKAQEMQRQHDLASQNDNPESDVSKMKQQAMGTALGMLVQGKHLSGEQASPLLAFHLLST